VSFDDEHILSGDAGGGLRLWSMDELRQERTLRHHTDAVTAVALLHGMPVSAGADGLLCVWDAAAPNTPLVALEAGGPLAALQLQPDAGGLEGAAAGGGVVLLTAAAYCCC
jgi:WD40 repeat protein